MAKKLKFGSKAYRLKYLGRGKKTKKTKVYTMARRKRLGFGKKRSKSSSGYLSKAMQILTGVGVAVLYEVFISPKIPLGNMIKNIVEVIVGIFLAVSKRMPMPVRAGGLAIATISAFDLILPYAVGMMAPKSKR